MIKGIIFPYLLKAILVALVVLVLFGVFSGTDFAIILMLFVAWRFISLAAEALRKPIPAEQWEAMNGALASSYEKLTPEQRAARAASLKLDPHLSARELAQAQVNNAIRSYVPPRSKGELSAEAFGVVAFAILIPLGVALYTRDFFSFRSHQGWEGAGVATICLGLYAWPHRWLKSPDISVSRTLWWALPFAFAFLLLIHAVESRHPYLNPFHHDRNRLAAERVLALKNNVVAGNHADWVLRYARQLDEEAKSEQAIYFYREVLRLDASNREASRRFTALTDMFSGGRGGIAALPVILSSAPYWTVEHPVTNSPRRHIDSQLEDVEGCAVVIVPVGQVSDELLDTVSFTIRRELELPVYIATDPVLLPPHTRVRGLLTGPQWDCASLIHSFTNAIRFFPRAPIRYVMITAADIYSEGASYVFSGSFSWGALVSSARYGEPGSDDFLLRHRTAKQTLCALLKSFTVPISPDRNCVTSYTRSLEEFDAKGNRPNAESLKWFRQAVADVNRGWQDHKAMQRVSK